MGKNTFFIAVLFLSLLGFVKNGSCAPADPKNRNSENKGSIHTTADALTEVDGQLNDDINNETDEGIAEQKKPDSSEKNAFGGNVSNNLQLNDREDDDEDVADIHTDTDVSDNREFSDFSLSGSNGEPFQDESKGASDDSPGNNSSDESQDTSKKKNPESKSTPIKPDIHPSEDVDSGLINDSEEDKSKESKSSESDDIYSTSDKSTVSGLTEQGVKVSSGKSDEANGNDNEEIDVAVSPRNSVNTSEDSKVSSRQNSDLIESPVTKVSELVDDDNRDNSHTAELITNEVSSSSSSTTTTSNAVSLSTDSHDANGESDFVTKEYETATSESTEKGILEGEMVTTFKDENDKISTRPLTKEIPEEQDVTSINEKMTDSTESHRSSSSPVTETTERYENYPESITNIGDVVTTESSTLVSKTTAKELASATVEIKSTEASPTKVQEDLGTTIMVPTSEALPTKSSTKSTSASTKKTWKKTKGTAKAVVQVSPSPTPCPDDNVTRKRKRPPPGMESGDNSGGKTSLTFSPASHTEPGKENSIGTKAKNEEINGTDIITKVKNTIKKVMNEYGETNVTIVVIIILIIFILLLCCCMRVCRGKRSRIRQRRLREIGQEKEFLLSNRDKGRSQYSDGVTLLEGSSEDEF